MNQAQRQANVEPAAGLAKTGGEQTRGLLAVYAIVVALLALGFTYWATQYPARDVELAILRELQSYRNPTLDLVMRLTSLAGFFPQVIPLNILFILILYVFRLKRAALTLIVVGPLIGISTTLLRYGIDRPRPSPDLAWVAQEIESGHFSFPSGHVVGFTAILGFIAYVGLRMLKPSWHRTVILFFYLAFILLIGFSRMYQGEHWPTDIIGGYLFGILWFVILVLFYQWLGPRRMPKWFRSDG